MKNVIPSIVFFCLLSINCYRCAAAPRGYVFWRLPAPDGELVCIASGAASASEPSRTLEYRLKSGARVAIPYSASTNPPLLSADGKYLASRDFMNMDVYSLADIARTMKAELTFSLCLTHKFDARRESEDDRPGGKYFRDLFEEIWASSYRPAITYKNALEQAKTDPKMRAEVNNIIKQVDDMIQGQLSPIVHSIILQSAGWLNERTLIGVTCEIEEFGTLTVSANLESKLVTLYVRSVKASALLELDDAWQMEHFFLDKERLTKGITLKFERGEIPPEVQKLANDLQQRREIERKEMNVSWKNYLEEMKTRALPKEP